MAFSFFKRKPKAFDEPFIENEMRNNWYQSNSYYPMPFGLVTTVNEEGLTSIGPHSFSMPYGIIDDYSMVLITRSNSNTDENLQRTKKVCDSLCRV